MKNVIHAIKQNWGAYLLFVVFGALFFVLLTRFLTLQITGQVEGRDLAAQAAAQYAREQILEAERGKILDRNGEVIAEDTTTYKVVAVLSEEMTTNPENPRHVTDPEKTAAVLAEYIDMPESEILERLQSRTEDNPIFQVEFGPEGRDLSHEVKRALEEEKLPGVIFLEDLKRFYPNGTFASHLIGFAQSVENEEDGTVETVGMMGIENSLDKFLKGTNGKLEFDADRRGYLLPNSEEQIEPAIDGNDVYLTIDKKIQTFLEDAMSQVNEKYEPTKMFGIVMDPNTGEILAMSQRPTFDPDTRSGLTDNWLNIIIEDTYEPGSTFKTFSLAAAVEEGVFNPNATYQSGTYKVADRTIRDHNNGAGWGEISYLEGFQRSSNVAVAKLLEATGEDKYKEYIEAFGFGTKTGIDLPNEADGNILYNYPAERVTTTFGQGTTVTPLQMMQAESAIATNGEMKSPYTIAKIVDPNTGEVVHQGETEISGKPISADTAEQVREYLASTVTSENGTGQMYDIPGYSVAGKSGTAQIPDGTGGYKSSGKGSYLFSFMGMAPAEDPELIVYVGVQEPDLEPTEIGNNPVSEVFNSVMENSLKYLNIQPSETPAEKAVEIPVLQGKTVEEAQVILGELGVSPVVVGSGQAVIAQSAEEESVLVNDRLILVTDGELTMPDLTGWSMRDVMKFSAVSGIPVSPSGSGYAAKQSIAPGTVIDDASELIVSFETQEEAIARQNAEDQESDEDSSEEELPQD